MRVLLALPSSRCSSVRPPRTGESCWCRSFRRGALGGRGREADRRRPGVRRGTRGADADRRLHAVSRVVRLVRDPAPRAQRAGRRATSCATPTTATTTTLSGRVRSTTRRSAAAPGWCCGSTSSTPRCGASTAGTAGGARRAPRRGARRRGPAARRRARHELAAEPALTLLCGRYEGFDERIVEHLATDAVSIGRYVLSGGELAAMVVADAVLRKLPGALGRRGLRRRGVLQRGAGGRRRVPALHAAGGVPRAGRCPRCCCRGHHERIREWRSEQARERSERGGRSLPYSRRPRPLRRRAPLLCHEHRHRQPRARAAAPRPRLPAGRPRAASTSR